MPRSLVVEHRPLAVARRLSAKPDDAAQLLDIIETMRNVPRESMASMPDMLFLLRRLSGRLAAVVDRLEPAAAPQAPRVRSPTRSDAKIERDAVIAGVFGKALRRDRTRSVTSRGGKRVAVLERASRQMELSL